MNDSLRENLSNVKASIARACSASGRDESDVMLLAVSKTKPKEAILELYEAGQREFGENYVQELREKAAVLPEDIHWHMIGHLQRNKVKYIAGFVAMIHSLDSKELALVIEKEAAKHDRVIPVLIEVNVAGEESKYGVSLEGARELAAFVRTLPHVQLKGFMTSAPIVDDPAKNRPVFRELCQLSVDMNLENDNNEKVDVLSMGMSGDYEIAIEEGATIVRIGTSLFGARK